MSHLSFWRRSALALVVASACSLAHAADVTARIKGTITDSTGAAIPNTTVTAINEATGVKYTTKSSTSGDYLFQALPIGTYDITVAPGGGFKGFEAKGIVLNIDQEYVEPVQLTVGTGESIEVQADTVQINTTDMQLGNVITSGQMEELPLIGRNFTGLELILPGVQASSDRFGTYSADGGQTQQSSYLINGADINDIALNTQVVNPNLDAIDQFNLIEGPLNAEYDRNSGGIVSATLKQGTNHFHGDGFEFYRDTFLNTANFFQTQINQDPATGAITGFTKPVTAYHQNIYGGTIGGPIVRDKLFAFFGFQGTHQRIPGAGGNTTVFTAAERGGNFSDALPDPVSGACSNFSQFCFTGDPIPSSIVIPGCNNTTDTWLSCAVRLKGIIPTSAFNPIASKLLTQYVPLPNSGSNDFSYPSVAATKQNQYLGRMDFSPNTRNTITFVGIYQTTAVTSTIPFTGASLPGFGEVDASTVQQYTADYTHQFSSTLLNDFALHYTRFNYQAVSPQNVVSPASLGFNILPQDAAAASVPTINVGGYFTLGFSTNGPQPRIDQNYQIDENISKSFGHHNLKFGYDGRKFQVTNPFNANNSGTFGFGGSKYTSGDPAVDFLVGNSSSYTQGSGAEIQAYALLNYFYAQDTWKLSNSFTFDYGIGYQIDTPLHSLQYGGKAVACYVPGQQSKIFPSAPQGLNYPGDLGCGNAAKAYTRYGDFGPRIGFAYAPELGMLSGGQGAKKLSIRGGFGIYYNRTEEETALQNLQTPPFGGSSTGAGDFGGVPSFADPFTDINGGGTEKNKFPFVFAKAGDATINFGNYESMFLNTYNANFRSPYAENFQLSVERELPSHIIARFTYVASLARHNQTTTEGNPVTQAGHDACLADTTGCASLVSSQGRDFHSYFYPNHLQTPYIDPNTGINPFAAIGVVGSEGSSNYNSFQASIQKGLSRGLQFQLSYTYAHALDEASNFENAGFGGASRGYNQFNKQLNYGDAAFDARQRLVFAPIYVVPFHTTGKAFSFTNVLLSGWQISDISTVATGFPFDISYGGTSSNSLWCGAGYSYYACPDEPNQIASIKRSNPRVRDPITPQRTHWFDGTGFAVAPIGTFGNTHRNEYHGPGINNSNVILAKNFAVSADGVRRVQIRMESDNAFNHTQFNNPGSGLSTGQRTDANNNPYTKLLTGGFGYISGVGGAANGRLTQLGAKFYF